METPTCFGKCQVIYFFADVPFAGESLAKLNRKEANR